MQEAIENYNGLFVCSAGNDYSDIDSSPIYPASFDLPNVITVGASDRNDAIWYDSIEGKGSNYGYESVDIFAPGVEILTTTPGGLYGWATGTSYATPMVTGVAALLLSENPDLLPEEIKYMIEASADPKQNLMGYSESGGRLNARKAVEYAEDHERIYVTSDNQYHTYMCDDCGFEEDMKHDLYVYSEESNNRVLRCRICNHSFQCSHTIACDVYTYDIYHMIRCVWCEYVILELHGPYTYSAIIGNNNYHTIVCQDCNHSTVQAHTWILKGSSYFCSGCGMTTNTRPPIVAGSIEDENETVSLPPVNDEEEYTE